MKKAVIINLVLTVLLVSCSSDEGNESSNIQIDPPSWIHGVWLTEGVRVGFEFTSNDVILIALVQDTSQREALESLEAIGETVSSNDEATSDYYSLTVNHPNGVSYTYSFNKESDTTIRWTSASSSVLIKQ